MGGIWLAGRLKPISFVESRRLGTVCAQPHPVVLAAALGQQCVHQRASKPRKPMGV